MNILGISCHYHDSAAALIQDGKIVAAAAEERFTRKKHDASFPKNAIAYCLEAGRISARDLTAVGFYEKPMLHFERILASAIATFPWSLMSFYRAVPPWIKRKLWIKPLIESELGYEGPIYFTEHHLAHAASSFFLSAFEEAAILTVDGVGEWATATQSVGRGNDIQMLSEMRFPHSLGLLYTAITGYLGFKVNSAEYKVMGLAPYGKPTFVEPLMRILDLKEDGSFALRMEYFAYHRGLRMDSPRLHELLGGPPRAPEGPIGPREHDIAHSLQKVTEEILLRMVRAIHARTGLPNLCLAGGVALNCVANGRILREGPFRKIFIQPAAGDDGGSLGVAAYIYNQILRQPRGLGLNDVFLGPQFSQQDIDRFLAQNAIPHRNLTRQELLDEVAGLIEGQKVVGWFQGRMEFGPRALGSRSILADARTAANKDIVNQKIKHRESFRPFAPTVLAEYTSEYFDIDIPSPYMLLVAQVRPAKRVIPAVTHVDGSARLQTISQEQNPLYHSLIETFARRTGVPVIINTSFNERGEPIVCTPPEAFRCFMRTDMDALVLGQSIIDKKQMGSIVIEPSGPIELD